MTTQTGKIRPKRKKDFLIAYCHRRKERKFRKIGLLHTLKIGESKLDSLIRKSIRKIWR